MSWPTVGIIAAAVGLAAAVLLGAWWLWWRLPKRQVDRLRLTISDPKARADVEDNFRKTIGQLLGGAAVLIGAGLAYLQFTEQQRNTQKQFLEQQDASRKQFEEQQKVARDLLISNQVAKGFELLGNNKDEQIQLRLGGIYALEGVMNNSEPYHQPILEALCSFVREKTRNVTGDGPPASDIQAALTVIGRRERKFSETGAPNLANAHMPPRVIRPGLDLSSIGTLNLAHAHISQAVLPGANLSSADLSHAHLSGANLTGANLSHAELFGVDLSHAFLLNADLTGADVTGADLTSANLFGVNLSNAFLIGADLRGEANLNNANLSGADLTGANLSSAWLHDTDLSGADLSGADLRGVRHADLSGGVNLFSQAQLDQACGINVKLDPGLTIKPCKK